MERLIGTCNCKTVKIEVRNKPFSFTLCHCSMCQKTSGSAFGAYLGLEESDIYFISGKDSLKTFNSSDLAKRLFCFECGCPVMYIHKKTQGKYYLTAGLFDKLNMKPDKQIFTKNKCQWI